MHHFKPLSNQAASDTLGSISGQEWGWLLSPRRHITLLGTRRAEMIISRARLVAALFALLTLPWSVVEWLLFPGDLWFRLAALRIAATLGFAALYFYLGSPLHLRGARRGLLLLFIIPSLFYLAANLLLVDVPLDGYAQAVAVTHTSLPFLVLAGLSMFPLTVAEALILAAPMLLAKVVLAAVAWPPADWPGILGTYWLLLLITGVAILASISQLAFVIVLVRQAIRDPLTSCFSRGSGEELLELQYIISARSGTPLAIAFLDIDHFKRVNDEFGHEAGDQVIIGAVKRISENLRTGDMLARWGGEEFILIMPNTDLAMARIALGRLREAGLGLRPDGAPLTVSIGVAERLADASADWKSLVEVADARMYEAKRGGRDRIVSG
ncbi:MAG: GGDEF domain-containing protein [Pseudomonadota bacterium]